MRVTQQEVLDYTKDNASYLVYYDSVKECVLKSQWAKLKNKHDIVNAMYKNGLRVFDAGTQIRLILKLNKKR